MSHNIEFVSTSDALSTIIKRLQKCDEIAIDLEFDKNYYRFGFNLCLIQIFDGEQCFLIDPLSPHIDVSKLWPVLENESITKVCFSFDEDLRLLHSLGCFPKNLFDLDTASRLLNYPAMSLTNLLIDVLDIDPGASSQKSNWYKRPLTNKQMNYAANDVLHLLKLKRELIQKAEKNGVHHWIKEENQSLNHLDYSDVNNNHIIKEKDKYTFNEVEWHIYKKLVYWRHGLAKKFNKPDFQLFGKNLLTELVKHPGQKTDWTNRRGIYKKIKTDHVAGELRALLDEALKEIKELGLSEKNPAQKPLSKEEQKKNIEEKKQINKLKQAYFQPVKNRIEELYGAEAASFILSNRIIEEIITGSNGSLKHYKKDLFRKCASDLNLDISPVEKML